MYTQIKVFANGIKAILKPQIKSSAILKIFDKDGCMIAQRKICRSYCPSVVEKMTLKADKAGQMSKEYKLSGFDENGLRIISPKRKVGIFEMFPRNLNDKGYYLFENEKSLYEAQKSGYRCGCIPSDATLINMHRQWFDRGKPRIKPKPIIEQLKLLINSLSLEMLKVN